MDTFAIRNPGKYYYLCNKVDSFGIRKVQQYMKSYVNVFKHLLGLAMFFRGYPGRLAR